MKFTINAKVFNGVLGARAVSDIRYYLNGFYLNPETLEIVGTNGHIMVIGDIEDCQKTTDETETGFIFDGCPKPLPRNVTHVTIDTKQADAMKLELHGDRYKGPRFVELVLIDGKYPAYDQVKADNDESATVPAVQGFNTEYLYRVFKWGGFKQENCRAKFVFGDHNKPCAIYPRTDNEAFNSLHITLMGCRV